MTNTDPRYDPLATGHVLFSEWAPFVSPVWEEPPPPCPIDGTPFGACTHDVGWLVTAQNEAFRRTQQ